MIFISCNILLLLHNLDVTVGVVYAGGIWVLDAGIHEGRWGHMFQYRDQRFLADRSVNIF